MGSFAFSGESRENGSVGVRVKTSRELLRHYVLTRKAVDGQPRTYVLGARGEREGKGSVPEGAGMGHPRCGSRPRGSDVIRN
jgi:hypothetical protein